MAESYFLLAATFIPLLLAPVAYIVGRKAGVNAATWLSFGALAVSTGLLMVPALAVYSGGVYVETYPWGQFGDFGLRLDGLSLPFALIIYILCTVLALYSKPYMVHKVMEDLPGHGGSPGTDSHAPAAGGANNVGGSGSQARSSTSTAR
jgi:NADH-quinone oxidoreductase subunit M